jgi:pilus assembly protein Flp/PilA
MPRIQRNFRKDDSGQGLVEYGLILALVSLALVGALSYMSDGAEKVFDHAATPLTAAESK